MSFPRAIQPLIVEDEHQAKGYYDALFQALAPRFQVMPPHWAFCHEDARQHLATDRIYHLVILDLRLPEQPGQPPAETLEFGLSLLRECLARNRYPIPALLVISGHLQHANQRELEEQARTGFFYGRVLVKSDNLEEESSQALVQVHRYCDVGIHLQDAGTKVFPTVSPREEDLLRRAVLDEEQRLGLDLAWWSAGYDPYGGWTKTLMGRFLLTQGRGHSLHTFFKLATADGAGSVFREAEVMGQKLKHVKVIGAALAGDRSLLITQAAGSGQIPPLSLDDVLGRTVEEVGPFLATVISTVAEQLAALGDRTPEQLPVAQLLWPHHSLDRIRAQWQRRGGHDALAQIGPEAVEPAWVYEHLLRSRTVVRFERQSCLHGDLNYTNIALEFDSAGGLHASIFDASGCQAGVCVRDLAMLEVTALLHQDAADGECLVRHCELLYDRSVVAPSEIDPGEGSHRARNTARLLASIRAEVVRRACPKLYALMVFDNTLMQLGGLDFGSAFNKIRNPRDAALLAALTARWLHRVAPELLDIERESGECGPESK